MENVIFDFKSRVGDGLKVYEDRVVISHSGVMNFFAMGIKGDKTIYYSDLTAVEFKKGGWTAGHIQFSLLGGRECVGGVLAAAGDENTVSFHSEQNELAEKIVAYGLVDEVVSKDGVHCNFLSALLALAICRNPLFCFG